MYVKVLIKRSIPKGKDRELITLITMMRTKAARMNGFISDEVLWNLNKPDEYLAISTWASLEDWEAWLNSEERKELQKKVDAVKGCVTSLEYYCQPEQKPFPHGTWPM